ncbi:glycosyltransferase family 4 protein [Reinekea sp.]|jgi:glycosyltransferase involved in cell wall biosynthesis|uniref:glycosyltransferase family 4 protein n=1 Tax=Reinekea sp. TaxID=1970455 RepID=UPI002A823A02|nr:glycosyltransferase family 4 protein [Reinekea sp.]
MNIVFDFIRSPEARLKQVESGLAPRESLLGYHWLKTNNFPVSESGSRHNIKRGFIYFVRKWIDLPSLMVLQQWRKADVVVVATRLSLVIALVVKLLGKKLVFYDAMQHQPRSWHRRCLARMSIGLADRVIFFSANQLKKWQHNFPVLKGNGTNIPYGIDAQFYAPMVSRFTNMVSPLTNRTEDQLISVGRDTHRDFATLVSALESLNMQLILVTQSYLIDDSIRESSHITIADDLSYQELAGYYNQSAATVVPIIEGTSHLSGIRAAMESMAMKVPVIITRNDSLEEYFNHTETVLFYQAEDVASLVSAIATLRTEKPTVERLTDRAYKMLVEKFTVEAMALALISEIESIR